MVHSTGIHIGPILIDPFGAVQWFWSVGFGIGITLPTMLKKQMLSYQDLFSPTSDRKYGGGLPPPI